MTKILIRLLLATSLSLSVLQSIAEIPDVNPKLLNFSRIYAEPKLVRLGENAFAAFAFEYSNFGFVVAPEGIIAVDTGWYPGPAREAIARLRAYTDKPVIALIYTHPHADHTAGSQAFLDEAEGSIPIFGHAAWETYLNYDSGALDLMIARRAYAQMGMHLAPGETVGSGIGPNPSIDGPQHTEHPTVFISDRKTVRLGGIDVEFIPSPGDIPENIMVWFPSEEVLFTGDLTGGVFPYIESARYEPSRNPRAMADSMQRAQSLEPSFLVPGHGPIVSGRQSVDELLEVNRNVILFIENHVIRSILDGHSADQSLENLVFPETLANHPDLQPHYHRIEWMLRGMYAKRVGWNERVDQLSMLPMLESQRRMISLMGGESVILNAAEKALEDDDPRWALRLVDVVLHPDPSNPEARRIRQRAQLAIAAITESANERNYLLTAVAEDRGLIDWRPLETFVRRRNGGRLSDSQLVDRLSLWLEAPDKVAANLQFSVSIGGGSDTLMHYALDEGVLSSAGETDAKDMSLSVDRATLIDIYAGELSVAEALSTSRIRCENSCARLDDFVASFNSPSLN